MQGSITASRDKVESLIRHLATSVRLDPSYILPFGNFIDLMTGLLRHVREGRSGLISAGHFAPEMEIAAHRAGMHLEEVLGTSPFVGQADDVLEQITSNREIIYLANPNWVTGASYSGADVDRLAQAVPRGYLIVDEKYVDHYGISALPLLRQYRNMIVLRSATMAFGIDADSSGYVVANPEFLAAFRDTYDWTNISSTVMTILTTTLISEDARNQRLSMLRDEALRTANRLTQMGVQNRMTSADFLLLRVADAARVGNALVRSNVAVENLDGYPDLKGYLKYRVQSPLSNETFLSTFAKMPKEYFHMTTVDRRMLTLHRPARSEQAGTPVVPRDAVGRAVRKRKELEPTSR